MDSKSQEIFNILFELPENKYCFECGNLDIIISAYNSFTFA